MNMRKSASFEVEIVIKAAIETTRPANSREHVLDDAHASIAATRFNYGMIAAAFDLIAK